MKRIKRSVSERIFDFTNNLIMVGMCIIMLYPFIHIASIAFSTPTEALRVGIHIYPKQIDVSSFMKVINSDSIWGAYYNTIYRTVVGTFLSVVTTGLGAYAISKKYLPSRRLIMFLILITMYFSGGIIPSYLLMRGLGLLNNVWSMILPNLVWGFNIIVMKNFFEEIPDSLEESAKIDGASDFNIFFRIIVPLSLPVIATIAIWMAVFHWNAYFDNLMYITDKSKYVLQRLIRNLVVEDIMDTMGQVSSESLKAATILISTLPIIMVFPIAQKYFSKGVMIGAVKG